MTPAPQPNPQEMNGSLKRIHLLGSATSELFSRLYQGLNRRSQLQQARTELAQTAQQAQELQADNSRLRRMLQERQVEVERLNAILASIDEGIIMQDIEGRIVMMNQAAKEFLGNQKNFWESELGIWFNEFRDISRVDSELVLMDRARRFEVNNRILGAQLAVVADSNGERIGTLIILRDITRATLAERIKDNIITSISHELRTPMSVMRLASEILLGQPEDAPANRKMLEKISRNIDVLDRMIIELLDVSEMSSGTFQIQQESVALENLLWEVVDSFEQDIVQVKLDMTFMLRDAERLYLTGDNARLKWAIGHLIRNAIVYNEPGGHIVLAAKLDEHHQQIILKIKDTGTGIAEKDLPSIFDLFYRGEARTKSGKRLDPRGLGQGLFIARRVTEAHGGTLTVESRVHEGSTFTLTLPAAAPALQAG